MDVGHFQRIPWCADLFADSRFVLCDTESRVPKQSDEDSFMAETLHTRRTIRAWVTQHRLPSEHERPAIRESRSFLDLGPGLNGYPGICHGGLIAALFDEITGVLLTVNADHAHRSAAAPRGINAMTAYLHVDYKNPVPTNSVVLGTAKITRVEGRKQYIQGTLEDGKGQVYATGEALFVERKPKL